MNKLFGVATQDQIEACQAQIAKAKLSNQRIMHTINELIALVNQSRDSIIGNRAYLLRIQSYLSRTWDERQNLNRTASRLEERIDAMDTTMMLDQLISALEPSHALWLRQAAKFQRQRASLELSFLTEEILPVPELQKILRFARRAGFLTEPPTWYYEHVRIQPLWEDDDRLVFRTHLPLSGRGDYLRYSIWTWPVPVNGSEMTVELQVDHDVAVDTKTGGVFRPHGCIGRGPQICRTGPVYRHGPVSCTRGILTGDLELRGSCKTTLKRPIVAHTENDEIIPGTYYLITSGKRYSILCEGQTEVHKDIESGLYAVTVDPRCKIYGDDWMIEGIHQFNSTVNLTFQSISITPFNLPNIVRHPDIMQPTEKLKWEQFHTLNNVEIRHLNVSDDLNAVDFWMPKLSHVSWFNFGISVLCIGIVCVVTFKVLARCGCNRAMVMDMIRRNKQCKRNVQQSHEVELAQINLNEESAITAEGVERVMPTVSKALRDSNIAETQSTSV